MSARISPRAAPRAAAQRGFILVTGLLFLVVMTLLALAMFRSTGLMDRITANTRDKQRSFEAAQSALAYAEWWLANNGPSPAAATCTGLVTVSKSSDVHVCNTAVESTFLTAAWKNAYVYTPPNLTAVATGTAAGGQVGSATTSDVNYYQLPGFYISLLGTSYKGGNVYQITAYGYGGDANTMSVLRSTYRLGSTTATGSSSNGLGGP